MTTASAASAGRKMIMYRAGVDACRHFLERNAVPEPEYVLDAMIADLGRYDSRRRRVTINLNRCRVPPKRPTGYNWSTPGWKADRTPYGVVCHETGHHVHALRLVNVDITDWRDEPDVSGYEPNRTERIAEALKLMIGNPDLLRLGRPIRFRTLVLAGLVPASDANWFDVLREHGAGERWIQAADNWIAKGRRS